MIATYSRVRVNGLPDGTPCQPSTTCGPDGPMPQRNRLPESACRVIAVIAAIAGARDLLDGGEPVGELALGRLGQDMLDPDIGVALEPGAQRAGVAAVPAVAQRNREAGIGTRGAQPLNDRGRLLRRAARAVPAV